MQKALHRRRALLGFAALAAAVLASAAGYSGEAEDRAALDQLFAELSVAPDAATARQIDQRIWIVWTVPSDPVEALRMREILVARQLGDYRGAIALADRMIVDYPTYAEAWNQRATLYYLLGEFEASLADIDKVLQYEPRHFGALSGRAMIYLQQGKRALALRDMARALKVHPFLDEQNLFPELKRDVTRI